jgi:hypothetical protein
MLKHFYSMEKTCFSNIIVFAICIINTTLCANALDFKYDGINYTAITDNTCMTKEGTYDNTTGNHTAGSWVRDDLIIPKIVYDSNGKSYAVTSIGKWSFAGCSRLSTVTILSEVASIEDGAFSQCTHVSSVTLPNSVTSIGALAFRCCTEVKSIIFEDGSKNLNIGYSAIGVPHTTYAYFGRQMDFTAMTYANLETVEFGDNVSSIKSCAFLKGNNIRTVISHRNIPPSTDDTFNSETYCNGILYVPEASVEKYANANGWKQFLNIKPLEGYDGVVEIPSHKNNLVVVSGSEIRVSSDKRVRILSINGTVFYNSIGDCCISVAPGIYIVIVGDTTTKVAVK